MFPLSKLFYSSARLELPGEMRAHETQRHFRAKLLPKKSWVKLNRGRTHLRGLRKALVALIPESVYISVTRWTFPERVGDRIHSRFAYPVASDFVVDIDSRMVGPWLRQHEHHGRACLTCLRCCKYLALTVLDRVKQNYERVLTVYSGNKGFHIWILDWEMRDWAMFDAADPIRSIAHSKIRYAGVLAGDIPEILDAWHYHATIDPLRVMKCPNTLVLSTRRIALPLNYLEIEGLSVEDILWRASALRLIHEAKADEATHFERGMSDGSGYDSLYCSSAPVLPS